MSAVLVSVEGSLQVSCVYAHVWTSQVALVAKNPPANAGDVRDLSLTHRSGRSPGGGHGNPL